MKNKILIAVALTALLSVGTFAQNDRVFITPEKITYKRSGKNVPDFKRTFDVTYPRILSVIKDPTVRANLKNSIDYWKNFEMNLEENLKDEHWLTDLNYRINFNEKHLLSITLIMDGVGAYPDQHTKSLVINLKTGKRVYMKDVFTNIPGLLVKIDKEQKAEIDRAKAKASREGGDDSALFERTSRYSTSKFDEFSISDAGVVFYFDYGFPHAVKAVEPNGKYFFSWADLKGHIRPDGPLASWVIK